MRKVITNNLKETHELAANFWDFLKKEYSSREEINPVLALSGDLGSGKTAFVQGLAQAMGIKETITSPTFVLMKKYSICAEQELPWKELVHIDAYRLDSSQELQTVGWLELQIPQQYIIAVEWPERVEGALPAHTLQLQFRFIDEDRREIALPLK